MRRRLCQRAWRGWAGNPAAGKPPDGCSQAGSAGGRGGDGRIADVLSRDVVVACIAAGGDPAVVTAADVAQHPPAAGDGQAAVTSAGSDLGVLGAYRLLAGPLNRSQLADALLCADVVLALDGPGRVISGPLPRTAWEMAGSGPGTGRRPG